MHREEHRLQSPHERQQLSKLYISVTPPKLPKLITTSGFRIELEEELVEEVDLLLEGLHGRQDLAGERSLIYLLVSS